MSAARPRRRIPPRERLQRDAVKQRFVATRRDAMRHGIARSTFTRDMQRSGRSPFTSGVWTPAGGPRDLLREAHAVQRALARDVVVTGHMSLWLRGLVARKPAHVSIVVPLGWHIERSWNVRVHRTSCFGAIRGASIQKLRAADPGRAFSDHAAEVRDVDVLIDDLAAAASKRRRILHDVGRELTRRQRFPGRAALRRAHQQLSGSLSHSRVEGRARRLLRTRDTRFTCRPHSVRVGGEVIGEVDTAIVELRYGTEIDGPPHLLPWVAADDRKRDRGLSRAGWTIDRFLWRDVDDDPEAFVAEVLRSVHRLDRRPR